LVAWCVHRPFSSPPSFFLGLLNLPALPVVAALIRIEPASLKQMPWEIIEPIRAMLLAVFGPVVWLLIYAAMFRFRRRTMSRFDFR
jgi:hypothetical protein